ncbi:hypothetical protein [Pseudoduganella lutea]|uniref:Uncharacterized protein n=1 Tax=Pseudoduganella lutea TaxID=321985 RepID=A0A4P6L4S8_9BURK|nr:hypothetical protein [Pseudoduganella lutea]QBE65898.1 hypothetical protein EWM63_25340 [Pseudoduganella lutea]
MRRRSFIVLGCVFMCPVAQAVAPVVTLAVLVKTLGEAGEAMSKVVKGMRDLVEAGTDSYGFVAAVRDRDRLKRLSVQFAGLTSDSNMMVLDSLTRYIAHVERAPGGRSDAQAQLLWRKAVDNFRVVLQTVHGLLKDLNEEKSDLVLQPVFLSLNDILHSRSSMLAELEALPPPTSREDLRLLKEAREAYRVLSERTRELIAQLNAYISRIGDTTAP